MRLAPNSRRRTGATLVEAAFVITIFLMFLFGIFEYGRFVMTRQLMDNAAREGARWAVVHTYDGTTAEAQDVVDQKLSMGRKQLEGYSKTTNIQLYAADANGNKITGKNWYDTAFGENIAVEVTGTFRPFLPNLLFMDSSISVSSRSVMASEAN